jgi:hypothetical protein
MATGTRGQTQRQPQPFFSLTPGSYDGVAVLDYSTKAGTYLYKEATSKLSEELYDCSPGGFLQFMKSVKVRVEEFGWSEKDRLLWIEPEDGENKISLITDYGQVTLERIQKIEDARMNHATRLAQEEKISIPTRTRRKDKYT